MVLHRSKFLHLALASFLATVACAQQPAELGRVVESLDSWVWTLHLHDDGAVWMTTDDAGLYRWKGGELRKFGAEDGLAAEGVRDLRSAPDGSLLISSLTSIYRFDGQKFEQLPAPETKPLPLGELSATDLWFTYDSGLNGPMRFDGKKLFRHPLPVSPDEERYRDQIPNWSFSPYGAYTVFRDRQGHIWIGTAMLGAARFDGKQVQWFYEPRLSTTPRGGESGVRGIFQDRKGDYWISNTRHRYTVAKSRPEGAQPNELILDRKPGFPDAATDDGENFHYFHSVVEDKDGALWFACGSGGVVRFHDERVTRYLLGEGEYSRAILLDAEGTVWAGTYQGGLYTLVGDRFELFQASKATVSR